jgi:hypothetical protein
MSEGERSAGLDEGMAAAVGALLERAGADPAAPLVLLSGSGNNRVFRVESDPPLLLKAYFHHPEDRRDRLGTEFAFLSYAWAAGLRTVPKPVAACPEHRLGLYGFLPGRRPLPGEISSAAVDQAAALVEGLNAPRWRPLAASLPIASEACFSLQAHLGAVSRRIERLRAITPASPRHLEARTFLAEDLEPLWAAVRAAVLKATANIGLALEAELAAADRCLSPSDFGFHNALATEDGRLSFLDFEYAGWDDPAKLVGDFFSQIAVPVPEVFYPAFADRLAASTTNPAWHRRRFDILLPVHRVKWITIFLNDFLPVGAERRRFAIHGEDEDARLATQLAKARKGVSRQQDGPAAILAAGA